MWKSILIVGSWFATVDWSLGGITPERVVIAAGVAGWAWASFRKSKEAKNSQDLSDANIRLQLKDSKITDLEEEKKKLINELSDIKQKLGEATGKLTILQQYDGKAVVEALGTALTDGMSQLRATLELHMTKHTEQLARIEANTKTPRAPTARSRKTDKP